MSQAAKVRAGSDADAEAADETQRRGLCPVLSVWRGALHSSHSQGFVAGMEGSPSRGRRLEGGGGGLWELRMLCAQGSTPRIPPSDLLIETNASCHHSGAACVDEAPVSRPTASTTACQQRGYFLGA